MIIKPFHSRGMSGIPDLDQYGELSPSVVTVNPWPRPDISRCGDGKPSP
jgi:hypothetical protein